MESGRGAGMANEVTDAEMEQRRANAEERMGTEGVQNKEAKRGWTVAAALQRPSYGMYVHLRAQGKETREERAQRMRADGNTDMRDAWDRPSGEVRNIQEDDAAEQQSNRSNMRQPSSPLPVILGALGVRSATSRPGPGS